MVWITVNVICVIVSLAVYLWLYLSDVKKSLCQNLMILLMTLSNIGYLCLSLSKNVDEAILANKIIYLGGLFIPLLYFFTVCEICHIRINKGVIIFLTLIQFFGYAMVCTIGYTDWYYKGVKYICENGVARIEKEYGNFHLIYPITMYGYFAASLFTAIRAVVKKNTINRKELTRMLIFAGVATVIYIIKYVADVKIEIMSFSFIVLLIGAINPIYHSNLYTVDENENIVQKKLGRVGFITFNKKREYMGSNDFALNIFPELRNYSVGRKINPYREELSVIFNTTKDIKALKIDDRIFDIELHEIENFMHKNVGVTAELRDETEHYKMLELQNRYNEELTDEVNRQIKRIRTIQENTILGIAQMVESRDLSTGGHVKRTSAVVRIFAKRLIKERMGFDKAFLDLVVRSAPMHDLGKIGVDDVILRKQGKFTDEEYEKMKKHAEIGGKMATEILTGVEEEQFVQIAHNVANYHHEKVNGKGYPEGLKGEEIPIEARIMALADVFDALVSKRCYKDAFSYDKAFSIIQEDAGSHFDYDLAMVFLKCRPELEEYYNNN